MNTVRREVGDKKAARNLQKGYGIAVAGAGRPAARVALRSTCETVGHVQC
jgi:hypothetical protein